MSVRYLGVTVPIRKSVAECEPLFSTDNRLVESNRRRKLRTGNLNVPSAICRYMNLDGNRDDRVVLMYEQIITRANVTEIYNESPWALTFNRVRLFNNRK